MSYCRWSDDNWKCDLYCYEDVSGGFTTHVAGNRIKNDVPALPDILETPSDEWLKAYRKQHAFLGNAERVYIGLPHDGESFNDPDLESFLERVCHLREVGYIFPDYVVESIKEEMKGGEKE